MAPLHMTSYVHKGGEECEEVKTQAESFKEQHHIITSHVICSVNLSPTSLNPSYTSRLSSFITNNDNNVFQPSTLVLEVRIE